MTSKVWGSKGHGLNHLVHVHSPTCFLLLSHSPSLQLAVRQLKIRSNLPPKRKRKDRLPSILVSGRGIAVPTYTHTKSAKSHMDPTYTQVIYPGHQVIYHTWILPGKNIPSPGQPELPLPSAPATPRFDDGDE